MAMSKTQSNFFAKPRGRYYIIL